MLTNSTEMKSRCYYWIGECFYAQNSYNRALDYFNRVYNEYKEESKASDALLKMGFTYTQMNDYNKAVLLLKEFINSYPTHRAVSLAEEKIRWIDDIENEEQAADSFK